MADSDAKVVMECTGSSRPQAAHRSRARLAKAGPRPPRGGCSRACGGLLCAGLAYFQRLAAVGWLRDGRWNLAGSAYGSLKRALLPAAKSPRPLPDSGAMVYP